MASQVSICNLALSWLGTNPITSIDDDTVEAKICKANYDENLKAVLEDRDWTFAMERLILTPLVETPTFGYSHAFLIPARVRRVVSVSDGAAIGSNVTGTEIDWQKEQNKIVANQEKIYVRTVSDAFDPAKYPSAYVHAFAARMAAEMSIPLTHSQKLSEQMWALYGNKITIASASDGRQGRREHLEASRLTRARRLGYPGGGTGLSSV